MEKTWDRGRGPLFNRITTINKAKPGAHLQQPLRETQNMEIMSDADYNTLQQKREMPCEDVMEVMIMISKRVKAVMQRTVAPKKQLLGTNLMAQQINNNLNRWWL